MKKYLLIVIALLGLMTEAWGQKVKPFEVELSVGTTYGLESYAGHRRLGPAFALEGRYNVSFLPIDFGAEFYMGSTVRHPAEGDLACRITSFSLLGDYNFMRGKSVSPFVGMGLGVAGCKEMQGSYGDEGTRFLFTARAGVELIRHWRVTAYSRACMEGYNNFGLSVGYVFGGGKK